jgi:hypothetical protein
MEMTLVALLALLLSIPVQFVFATVPEDDLSNNTWSVKINHQVQLVADVTNNQTIKQPFTYIVQVQNSEGKVVLLSWVTGSLQPHQSLSPAQSWTPTEPGTYTAQIFNWPCLELCGALSYPLAMKIIVT